MNQEIKAKWIAALRGGEYKQGRASLRKGDEYCCLGVLCDLHAKATGRGWHKTSYAWEQFCYYDATLVLPQEVMDWAELSEKDPAEPDGNKTLAQINDDGETFEQISGVIERHL